MEHGGQPNVIRRVAKMIVEDAAFAPKLFRWKSFLGPGSRRNPWICIATTMTHCICKRW
jgi:hypothetical protein